MGEADNVKSFYDYDYVIEMGEKRLEQYTAAYQLVLGRLTNIILIYTALGIYLVPLIQEISLIPSILFKVGLALFILFTAISLFFTIRLLIPVDIAYLQMSSVYYQELRAEYEREVIKPEMNPEQRASALKDVNDLLKASYNDELVRAQSNNQAILRRKGSFYYNALIWGLMAILPYIICVGFHITRKVGALREADLITQREMVSLTNQ